MIWANEYVGGSWSAEFNCWHWFRLIQAQVFKRDVPLVTFGASHNAIAGASQQWRRVANPKDGDALVMLDAQHKFHIGVWCMAGGVVIHACQGYGVIADDLSQLPVYGLRLRRVYTWRNS